MVFLIAIIPALIVFMVGIGSASKSKTRAWAIIAVLLGVFTGNPAFMVLDLVAVAIAYGIASLAWHKPDASALSPPNTPAPIPDVEPTVRSPVPKASDLKNSVFLVVGFAALCYFLIFSGSGQPQNAAPPALPPVPSVQYKLNKPVDVPQTKPAEQKMPHTQQEAPVRKRAATMEDCLKIIDDKAMARCMERAK